MLGFGERVQPRRRIPIIAALAVGAAIAGCSSSDPSDSERRGAEAVEACREHDGVAAFDDDAVICADQTAAEERGENAVDACRERGGVAAFDDDIVICRDETFHEAEGG